MRFYIFILLVFVCSCSKTSEDAIEHYQRDKTQLLELKNYVSSIAPQHLSFQLKLNSGSTFSIFIRQDDYHKKYIQDKTSLFDEYQTVHLIDKKIDDTEVQKVFSLMGWSSKTIDSLRFFSRTIDTDRICYERDVTDNLLTKKTFISVGFPTYELYSLEYVFLENTLTEEESNSLETACNYMLIDSSVLLKYRGGSRISGCFQEKRK